MRRRISLLVLSSFMLLALVIRVKGIGATNLWLDEANSWRVASMPWSGMLDNLRASPLGPLYFAALKLWIGVFGDAERALRMPSLVAGVLLVPVTWAIGARVLSRRAAMLGAALVALSPLHLYFSREARMYEPLALLGALCVLAHLHWRRGTFATRAPARQGRAHPIAALAAYVLLALAALFTNPIAALLLVALNVDAAITLLAERGALPRARWWRAALGWTIAQVAVLAPLFGALSYSNTGSAGSTQLWRPALGAADATRAFVQLPLTTLHGIYYYTHDFWPAAAAAGHLSGMGRFLELFVVGPGLLLALVAALAAAAPSAWRGERRAIALAWLVPTLIAAAISTWRELDLARYTLYATPFLLLLVADGIEHMRRVPAVLALGTMLAATALGTRHTNDILSRDSDYRPVARLLARDTTRAPAIVQPREMAVPLLYYLRHAPPRRIIGVPAGQSVAAAIAAVHAPRVWVALDYRSPLSGLAPQALSDSLRTPVLDDGLAMDAGSGVRLALVAPPAR